MLKNLTKEQIERVKKEIVPCFKNDRFLDFLAKKLVKNKEFGKLFLARCMENATKI